MKQDLYDVLSELLLQQNQFLIDKRVSKELVIKSALELEPDLLALLLNHPDLKRQFFRNVANTLVFDKVHFQKFVQNRRFLPDSYTSYRISIGLSTTDEYLADDDRVVINWPYKDCLLQGGQTTEDDVRAESFLNEIISLDRIANLYQPKALANFEFYSASNLPESIDNFDNFVVKGNNLLGLRTILPRYQNSIDVIYIDPPYYFRSSKGSDTFAYNSNFKLSTWLTFMKNRLETAKMLLSSKSVIFISINDDSVYHLKILCDEIFGVEFYISNFIWKKRAGGGNDAEGVAMDHEYILCYGNVEALRKLDFSDEQLLRYKYSDEKMATHGPYCLKNLHDSSLQDSPGLHFDIQCPDGSILEGKNYQWKCNLDTFLERLNDNRIVFSQDKNGKWRVEYKIYLYENKGKLIYDENGVLQKKGIIPNALLDGVASNADGTKDLKKIFPEHKKIFAYPKPVKLIKHLLKLVDNPKAQVLDFFAGSGTTGQAVLELNREDKGERKFILVEQMDYVKTLTSERISRVADKSNPKEGFVYMELKSWNQVILDKAKTAGDRSQLLDLWRELKSEGFVDYQSLKVSKMDESEFEDLSDEDFRKLIVSLIDMNQLYVPLSQLRDIDFKLTEQEIRLNEEFFGEHLND